MFKEVPQLTKNPVVVGNYRESIKKKNEMDYYKEFFDDALANEKYSDLATMIIELQYETKFANYMCIAPNFDLEGNKIDVFDKDSKMMRRVFVTAFPRDGKSYILISVSKNDLKIYEKYLKSFEQVSSEVVKYYFNALIPLSSENLIISPDLWNEWDEIGQGLVQVAVSEPNPVALLMGLKMSLKNISKKDTSDFLLTKVKYNLFGKENVGAEINIVKTY